MRAQPPNPCVYVCVCVCADSVLNKALPPTAPEGEDPSLNAAEVTYVYVPVRTSIEEPPEHKLKRVDSGELLPSRAALKPEGAALPPAPPAGASPSAHSSDDGHGGGGKPPRARGRAPRRREAGSDGEMEALLLPGGSGSERVSGSGERVSGDRQRVSGSNQGVSHTGSSGSGVEGSSNGIVIGPQRHNRRRDGTKVVHRSSLEVVNHAPP